jgi:tetratricopeptide (TPR) repeat protein
MGSHQKATPLIFMPKSSILYPLTLALSLTLSLTAQSAFTRDLNAPPLPHERDVKDFSDQADGETIIPQTGTRFVRRHDYREDDKQKAEADEKAKKDAAAKVVNAKQQQVDAYKQALQTSIDANNQAVALGKQGRWEEAIAEHEKACQYDPRNKQFRINLSAADCAYGEQRMAKGDCTSAVSNFRKALAAAPDNGLAGRDLVACLKKMGYNPSNPDTRIQLGDQLAAAGDLQGATIEYTAAMQLEPSSRTYIKMGDMAYRFGQSGQATNWYRQAIVKDPDNGAAHRQLGFLEMATRDYTSAAASLRKAVILDSKDVAAGTALVDLWRRQVAANPLLAENHLGLAGALQLTGDFNGAESEYRRLEALDPKNPSLESGRASLSHAYQHAKAEKHKLAAETLFNQGLTRESLEEITQAATLEPRNAAYQYLLGECLESVGDYQGAHQCYLTCVLIDPENNKEAAFRLAKMQERGRISPAQSSQMATQIGSRLAGQYNQQAMAAPQAVAQPQAMSAPQAMAPRMSAPQVMAPAAMQQAPTASMSVPANDSASLGFRKNMYEGGSGLSASPVGFRTHDESPEAAAAAAAAAENQRQQAAAMAQQQQQQQQQQALAAQQQQQAAPQANAGMIDAMAKVTDAEAQRDYNTAISLLRDISSSNLQNPEIHHRLAVNLLAAGQISEAISEFRIASALCPAKKAYSDDLAQALAINKRSLMNDTSSTLAGQTTTIGATGASK